MAYKRGQLPRLRTYADAVAHYEGVKPLRTSGERPLGLRRRVEARIGKVGDDIHAVLYETSVLVFKPDNSILIQVNGHSTQMTASFISCVLGIPVGAGDCKVLMRYQDSTFDLSEGAVLTWDSRTLCPSVCVNVPTTVHRVNRDVMKSLTTKYSMFIQYMKNMAKIKPTLEMDEGFFSNKRLLRRTCPPQQVAWASRNPVNRSPGSRFYDGNRIVDKSAEFLLDVQSAQERESYEEMLALYKELVIGREARSFPNGNTRVFPHMHPDVVVGFFKEVLMLVHADVVFRKEVLPNGVYLKDRYQHYINGFNYSKTGAI